MKREREKWKERVEGGKIPCQKIVVPIQQLDPEDILSECSWMFEVETQTIKDNTRSRIGCRRRGDIDDSCDPGHGNQCH